MASSSTDRSEVNYMEVPELTRFSEWKKTPVASFSEEEKNILSWDMDISSKSFDDENQIVFWRAKYKELSVQQNGGEPMARDDMRQFRNVVIKSLSKRLHTSGFILAQVGVNPYMDQLDKFPYNMDGLCKFFELPHPTDDAEAEKGGRPQMFVQLLAAVMKHLFPSVYKYEEHGGIFGNHIMEVIKKKSPSTGNWTGWEDHQLIVSKVNEMWSCMGCQTIIAVYLVDTVLDKFRSWRNTTRDAELEKRKKAAEEDAKKKAEEAKAAAAEFMAKFQQLDPAVRTLVESQIQPSINPALIQALSQLPQINQLQQQITSPLTNVAQSSSNTPLKETNETDGASSSSATTTTTTTTTKKNANVEDKEEEEERKAQEKEIEDKGLVLIETPTKKKGLLETEFPKHKEILDGSFTIKLKTYIEFATLKCGEKISTTDGLSEWSYKDIDHEDLRVEATVSGHRDTIPKSITTLNLKHETWEVIFSEAAENYDINAEVDKVKDYPAFKVYDLVTFNSPNSLHHGTKFYIIGMDVDALDVELLFADTPLSDNLEDISLKDLEHHEGVYPKEKPKSTTVGKRHGKTLAVPKSSPLKSLDSSNIIPGKRSRPPTNTFVAGAAVNQPKRKKEKKRMR